MGIFTNKPTVRIQEFLQDLYDKWVFHPIIAGQDVKWFYIDSIYDDIVKIDKLFSLVDKDVFRKEMLAIRMEMVGLAFTHNVKKKDILYNQSLFTVDYLNKNNQSELWDIMGEYNNVIALSTTYTTNGERTDNRTNEIMNIGRISLASEYSKKYGQDDKNIECMARIINREFTEVSWNGQIMTVLLTSKFATRVRCNTDIDTNALTAISTVIFGFYQGAKEAINDVNFQF
jgi:hypothetical protein